MTMRDVLYLEFKPQSNLKIFVMTEELTTYSSLAVWPDVPEYVTIDKETGLVKVYVQKVMGKIGKNGCNNSPGYKYSG